MGGMETYLRELNLDNGCSGQLHAPNRALVFGRYPIQLSSRSPALMTAVLRDFPQFMKVNSGTIFRSEHNRFLLNPFKFNQSPDAM
jgi:hypothetical protein